MVYLLRSLVLYLSKNNTKPLSAMCTGVESRGDERLLWDCKWFSLVGTLECPESKLKYTCLGVWQLYRPETLNPSGHPVTASVIGDTIKKERQPAAHD
jgi:hypothetical protein